MRYPQAEWRPSPNFDRRQVKPSFLVVHITDGGPSFDKCVERFTRRETRLAPHFVVGRDGEVTQVVDTADRAWHCSGWNTESVGIEHVARTPNEFKNWQTLSERARKSLVAEGTAYDGERDPGLPLTQAQLLASSQLAAWLCRMYGWPVDRFRLRGHYENPRTTHADCGLDVTDVGIWPWTKYLEMVKAEL